MSNKEKLDVFENMKRMIVNEDCVITLSKPAGVEPLAAYIDYDHDYKLTKIDIAALETLLDGEFEWAAVNDHSETLTVKIKLKEPPQEGLGIEDL